MLPDRRGGRFGQLIVLVTAIGLGYPVTGLGQEHALSDAPEPASVISLAASPFAVGGTARKALPPVDGLRCVGPAPCTPCDGHHRGFLYFGTCVKDDDCRNDYDDCPDGNCGYLSRHLSRAWIEWRQHSLFPLGLGTK